MGCKESIVLMIVSLLAEERSLPFQHSIPCQISSMRGWTCTRSSFLTWRGSPKYFPGKEDFLENPVSKSSKDKCPLDEKNFCLGHT
jgi:hypothetical protein